MSSHMLTNDIYSICQLPTGMTMDFNLTAALGCGRVATTVILIFRLGT